jgi:hypothetical protein
MRGCGDEPIVKIARRSGVAGISVSASDNSRFVPFKWIVNPSGESAFRVEQPLSGLRIFVAEPKREVAFYPRELC